MRPSSRHPLVQGYYAELKEATAALDEVQRAALLDEAVGQLNVSIPPSATDAEVKLMLESFASPEQVAAAWKSDVQADALPGVPTGAAGLYLGVVAMVFLFIPWVSVALGAVGAAFSYRALRRRRAAGAKGGLALGGVAVAIAAVIIQLSITAVLAGIDDDQSNPEPNKVYTQPR